MSAIESASWIVVPLLVLLALAGWHRWRRSAMPRAHFASAGVAIGLCFLYAPGCFCIDPLPRLEVALAISALASAVAFGIGAVGRFAGRRFRAAATVRDRRISENRP